MIIRKDLEMKINEKGRSMIEMLGVLSIAGILSMASITLYTKTMYQRKIGLAMGQVSDIAINVHNAFHSRRTISIPTTKEEDVRGLIPVSMWKNNTDMEHALGGPVKICNGSAGKEFNVKFAGLNIESCVRLATGDWGAKTVCVNKGEASDCPSENNSGTCATDEFMSISDATVGCSDETGNTNYVIWTFK